jgi:hypothetical protein
MSDIFQDALRAFPVEAGDMKDATIDVLDAADICLKWFESRGVAYTAFDLIAGARLILERLAVNAANAA